MSAAQRSDSPDADAPDRAMECRICWYVYDPAVGDAGGQVAPGTPFDALPADWRCPVCDGDRTLFLVRD